MGSTYCLIPFLSGSVPNLGLDSMTITKFYHFCSKFYTYCWLTILGQLIVYELSNHTCLSSLCRSDQNNLEDMSIGLTYLKTMPKVELIVSDTGFSSPHPSSKIRLTSRPHQVNHVTVYRKELIIQ